MSDTFFVDNSRLEHACCWNTAIVKKVPKGHGNCGRDAELVAECRREHADIILAALNASSTLDVLKDSRLGPTNHIRISAYRQDEEPTRIDRLLVVKGYIFATSHFFGFDVCEKIVGLHDRKGTLTVTWREEPSIRDKAFCKKAWESPIGDGGGPIEHRVIPC